MLCSGTETDFRQPYSIVIHDSQTQQWLHFHNPTQVLTASTLDQVIPLLRTVQQQVERGHYAAGFVSYEAAPAFDPSLRVHTCDDFPLVWFGLYAQPQVVSLPTVAWHESLEWMPSIAQPRYQTAFAQIKDAIAQGLTYQVNFSFRLRAAFAQDPWRYFCHLIQSQQSLYGAFINLEDWAICCASPELFFRLDDRTLSTRPMKGTAPRGMSSVSDLALAKALRSSVKNQAENLMIVDMIRNDLGRIAQLGSVQVKELFAIEQYPTLWQMTSPVECLTDAGLVEILQALFPCASITGAPKSSTMQIIADLEDSPRQLYTGAIGFVSPNRTAQFNVAIRTVLVDKVRQTAEYGVGGGIVWDSVTEEEFAECCTKAKILGASQPSFQLLESLLWTPESGYFLLDQHLQRLQASAAYFAFAADLGAVSDRLGAIAQTLPAVPHKVRLWVAREGAIQLAAEGLEPSAPSLPVSIAKVSVDSADVFLYHKTTHRVVYEQAKQACPSVDEVLLWNERQELTEFCTANLVVEWDGQWYTPPVECGLLAGTYRAWLLQQGKVQERVLRLADLTQYSRLFLVNSVRHMREAIITHHLKPLG